jgi:hypothetical protein
MIVVTEELLRSTAPGAEASFGKHLRAAVAATLDSDFLATVAAGATVTLATASPMADLRNLLNTVNTAGAAHRPYWIMVPTVANLMSTLTWANGGRLFPEMTPTGGTILGLPPWSRPAPSTSAGRPPSIVSCSSTARASRQTWGVSRSTWAATRPLIGAGASGPLVSLWQANAVGLLAKMYYAALKFRSNAVALLDGIAWS